MVIGNKVYDNQGTKTQSYGINVDPNSVNNVIEQNDVRNSGVTGTISATGGAFTSNIFKYNIGYTTENQGTATISASTSVTFNHNMVASPLTVIVSPQSTGYGTFGVTAVTSTQITITVTTSGTYVFYWYASTY